MEIKIYSEMLLHFADTLKKTSEDINKPDSDKYMTLCEREVVNLDKVKNDYIKKMRLAGIPLSCVMPCIWFPMRNFLLLNLRME